MNWVACGDRSDGYVWQCRKQINAKRHWCERLVSEKEAGSRMQT